ncbi:transcriptional regulator, ArsR family, partial [mine drainage metagenome]
MEALEDLLAASSEIQIEERPDIARVAPLRQARMCYDHLAGRLGVSMAEQFQGKGWVSLEGKDFQITDSGRYQLGNFGIDWPALVDPDVSWPDAASTGASGSLTVGGAFGAALATRFMELDWIRRT